MHSRLPAQAGRAKTSARQVRGNTDNLSATGLSRADVATLSRQCNVPSPGENYPELAAASQSVHQLGVDSTCDRQIIIVLEFANGASGFRSDHPIDLAAVITATS
jgi:hypothetical protein